MDINSTEGAVAFRNNATTDYTFYVHKDAIDSEIFTVMYLTLEETDELACYSEAYEEKVDETKTSNEETIKYEKNNAEKEDIGYSSAWLHPQ